MNPMFTPAKEPLATRFLTHHLPERKNPPTDLEQLIERSLTGPRVLEGIKQNVRGY